MDVNYAMNAIRDFSLILVLAAMAAGCASHKDKSDAQIRRAYAAGAEAARQQMLQGQTQQPGLQPLQPATDPQVRILGPVKNSVVLWTDGLTLGRALVQAEYLRNNTPSAITIYRNNQPLQIDPQLMLQGADYPLFPGDIVYIQD
jgi:hypothetical protein